MWGASVRSSNGMNFFHGLLPSGFFKSWWERRFIFRLEDVWFGFLYICKQFFFAHLLLLNVFECFWCIWSFSPGIDELIRFPFLSRSLSCSQTNAGPACRHTWILSVLTAWRQYPLEPGWVAQPSMFATFGALCVIFACHKSLTLHPHGISLVKLSFTGRMTKVGNVFVESAHRYEAMTLRLATLKHIETGYFRVRFGFDLIACTICIYLFR